MKGTDIQSNTEKTKSHAEFLQTESGCALLSNMLEMV
jgi:hypothetical protein